MGSLKKTRDPYCEVGKWTLPNQGNVLSYLSCQRRGGVGGVSGRQAPAPCFSNFNECLDCMGILLKWRLWFSRSGMAWESESLTEPGDASPAGLSSTFWEVGRQKTPMRKGWKTGDQLPNWRERGREKERNKNGKWWKVRRSDNLTKRCLLNLQVTPQVIRMQLHLSILGSTDSLEGCSSQNILH